MWKKLLPFVPYVIGALVLLGVGAALFALALGIAAATGVKEPGQDIYRAIVQLAFVSVGSWAITIALFLNTRGTTMRKDRMDALRLALGELQRAYFSAKRERRIGRFNRTVDRHIRAADYAERMAAISDAQLEIEGLADYFKKTAPKPLQDRSLAHQFDRMETYLSKLIDEFEERGGPAGDSLLPLNVMPAFAEFIGFEDDEVDKAVAFFTEFADVHHDIVKALSAKLNGEPVSR